MSFVLRQIARAADGREIARTRRLNQDELAVGRDPGCEVHLADLAVSRLHALIRRVGPRRVEVSALANLPFEVDGRSTSRAEIDLDRGATVRIGSHSLAFAQGSEPDEAAITVERVGALSDLSEPRDDARIFTLAGVAPGKRISAWALSLLVLLAALAWPVWSFQMQRDARRAPAAAAVRPVAFHPDSLWSPGKLSRAHANLEGDCQACHVEPFVSVRDASCRACHVQVHDHADPRRIAVARGEPSGGARLRLAVGRAFNRPEGGCVDCHSEHAGAGAMPMAAQRFCSDCHATLDRRLRDTSILDAGDFGTDHPEFRPAVVTNPSGPRPSVTRISLTAAPLEQSGLKFPHRLHLSASNGVARMTQTLAGDYGFGASLACKDCHVRDASGVRFQPVMMERNCGMCHSLAFDRVGGIVRTLRHGDPQAVVADLRAFYRSTAPVRPIALGGMARRVPGEVAAIRVADDYARGRAARPGNADRAIRAVFSPGGACYDCHQVLTPAASGTGGWGVVPVRFAQRYMAKGWFDHRAHDTEKCTRCHAAPTSDKASDVLLPGIATCRQCHGGESAHRLVPSGCAMCHDYHATAGAPLASRGERRRGEGGAAVTPVTAGGGRVRHDATTAGSDVHGERRS